LNQPDEVDWNATQQAEALLSATRSAWGSLVTAIVGVALLLTSVTVGKLAGDGSPMLQKLIVGLLYSSPFLLIMSLLFGVIALKSGVKPVRLIAIAGIVISGPLCLLGVFFACLFLSWLGTTSGWQ